MNSKSNSQRVNKTIDELTRLLNGGAGSGNFGHAGRIGEVGGSSSTKGAGKQDTEDKESDTEYSDSNYLSKKEYQDIVDYSNEDNFTEEELDAIDKYAQSSGYGASCDLNQAIKENPRTGAIEENKTIIYPMDDSQIVTWKDNKKLLEKKMKEQEAYEKISAQVDDFRKFIFDTTKDRPEVREQLTEELKQRVEKLNDLYYKINYSDYENYVENYKNGVYDSIKDDQKMWTIDTSKLSKVSTIDLRKEQQANPDSFYEKIEIPRLFWPTHNPIPTTTDSLATRFGRQFKELDKLDKTIKEKGYVLDKDITVTRRVANLSVIKDMISKSGAYTQNGITSVTAAKSIVQKMPSGVHMGNDIIRITIPKGTRVVSTFKPFEKGVQKSADKYSQGKLTAEDNRNLRMLKGQNELILPSGSTFVSPGGNNLTKNADGSYQLILKKK